MVGSALVALCSVDRADRIKSEDCVYVFAESIQTLRNYVLRYTDTMRSKSKSMPRAVDAAVSRVALTLKISKDDYVRLTKLRLKELEAGRDVSHQDILYRALQSHMRRSGV